MRRFIIRCTFPRGESTILPLEQISFLIYGSLTDITEVLAVTYLTPGYEAGHNLLLSALLVLVGGNPPHSRGTMFHRKTRILGVNLTG
jgi:hypothetical protein